MNELQVSRGTPPAPLGGVPTVAIRDGDFEPRDPAPSARTSGETFFGNASRNGRSAFPLPPRKSCQLRFARDLREGFGISALFSAGPRVYVEGKNRWALLDATTGLSRAGGVRGRGTGALDAALFALYQPDEAGKLQCLNFDAGQKLFWSPLRLEAQSERPFVARLGDSLFVLSLQPALALADKAPQPALACLEALPLSPLVKVGQTLQLRPPLLAPLFWNASRCVAAASGSGVVIAFPGQIYLVDSALEVVRVLSGAFDPVALSVDESGFLHLIVDEPEGGRALWVVDSTGVRQLRVPLLAPFDQATTPPIILLCRQIIVQSPGRLLCLGADGGVRWVRRTAVGAGAIATADDQLVVADGRELCTFDREGQRAVLHRFETEELRGAPILEPRGEFTVATKDKVLRLVAKR